MPPKAARRRVVPFYSIFRLLALPNRVWGGHGDEQWLFGDIYKVDPYMGIYIVHADLYMTVSMVIEIA